MNSCKISRLRKGSDDTIKPSLSDPIEIALVKAFKCLIHAEQDWRTEIGWYVGVNSISDEQAVKLFLSRIEGYETSVEELRNQLFNLQLQQTNWIKQMYRGVVNKVVIAKDSFSALCSGNVYSKYVWHDSSVEVETFHQHLQDVVQIMDKYTNIVHNYTEALKKKKNFIVKQL